MSLRERSDYYERLALDNLKAGNKHVDITDNIFKYPAIGIKKTVIEIAQQICQKTGWEIRICYYDNIQAEEEYYGEVRTRPYYTLMRVLEKGVPRKKLFGIFRRKPIVKKVKVALADIERDVLESIFGPMLYCTIFNDEVSEIIKRKISKCSKRYGKKIEIIKIKATEE